MDTTLVNASKNGDEGITGKLACCADDNNEKKKNHNPFQIYYYSVHYNHPHTSSCLHNELISEELGRPNQQQAVFYYQSASPARLVINRDALCCPPIPRHTNPRSGCCVLSSFFLFLFSSVLVPLAGCTPPRCLVASPVLFQVFPRWFQLLVAQYMIADVSCY